MKKNHIILLCILIITGMVLISSVTATHAATKSIKVYPILKNPNTESSTFQACIKIGTGYSGTYSIFATVWGRQGGPSGKAVSYSYYNGGRVYPIFSEYWGSEFVYPYVHRYSNLKGYIHVSKI